ncbi:hypothetical protein BCR32DRAFT_282643 [Anaeromyces robustus]|uniref:Uncharacterized protein n=1 Tax=Anaeromyces robustus TaxID=1754192 RepID=A0A1Y1WWW1_9FUNG|nr:hypothetical protein BCR32DRAFT_282643 [Anaeromyces robustus]|eukprot:ORX78027.1 hypothetical protein BCR32DRAFT_282643 [Anaeromyces robustus]
MLTAVIIQTIFMKKFSIYLEKYLNNINLLKDFRTYSNDEDNATFISIIIIFWMLLGSTVILYFAYLKSRNINVVLGFIYVNSIYEEKIPNFMLILWTALGNIFGISHLLILYKFPSFLDKYTYIIVKNIKNKT